MRCLRVTVDYLAASGYSVFPPTPANTGKRYCHFLGDTTFLLCDCRASTIRRAMAKPETSPKIGQEYGAIRSSLPLDRLVPYLVEHIDGFTGPVEVKQFSVSRVFLPFPLSSSH